ncbi:MAG: laccase domain-containing protein [Chloroflexi bacterium]|nr:laccase domain-containing protein [Chloroflexota bacterium]
MHAHFALRPAHQAVGPGHAGLAGTVKVAGAMVAAMQREFGSRPADLIAGIGPCIGPCCYGGARW